MAPLVSVIVLNYNGKRFLDDCFNSLLQTTYSHFEIVMVDNASTEDDVVYVQQKFPQVRIIQNTSNAGFSKAYNIAFEQCQGKYFVLLNNDVKVRPNWLEPMVEALEADEKIAAAQPKLLDMKNPAYFEYAGASGGFLDIYGYPFTRGRVIQHIEKDEGQYDDIVEVFWTTGAAMFVRASVLKQTGGLDETFVHHMEEIDLCWRMHLHGYKLIVVPQSIVEHFGGGTISYNSYKKMYWNHRNSIFMLMKNLEKKNLIKLLLQHILLDIAAMMFSFFQLHFKHIKAVAKAHLWIFTHLQTIKQARSVVQKNRTVNDDVILKKLYPKSMALQYFILGKKTYTSLYS